MKHTILFIASLLALGFCQAQEHVVHVHSQGQEVHNFPAIGSSRMFFSNDTAVFDNNRNLWKTLITDIDSLTFTRASDNDDDTLNVDFLQGLIVTWDGQSATIQNPYSALGVEATSDSGHVTISSSADDEDLTFLLLGQSTNGSVTINSKTKFILGLSGLTLTNPEGPAILITSSSRGIIHLADSSVISDGTANSNKGALQSSGKLVFMGRGALSVSGRAKHGIQTSKSATIKSGNIHILTAKKDGFNVDNYIQRGGNVTVTGRGDGIDGDQGYIDISGGSITINCTADDVKGLGCDSTITISGGTINITVSGDQSKGIKAKSDMYVTAGDIIIHANGSHVLEASGSGYDPSYCTGFKVGGNLIVSGANTTITCPDGNAGGRAISCDGNISIDCGRLNLTATGTCGSYTNAEGVADAYASTCMKAGGNIYFQGGILSATAGGRAISCDGSFTQYGGSITTSTSAAGFTLVGSGTSCTDGFAPACLKSDSNITFVGGSFTATSTGNGGRGIVADGQLIVGQPGGNDDMLHISVTTSGNPVNASSGGGFPGGGGPGGNSADYWKGLPKGVKIDGDIHIYSGHLQSYCSQASGDPNGEAIETKGNMIVDGGVIEANSYDDAINAGTGLTVNDGKIWAYSRGNDAIDNNGSYTYIYGGTIIALSDREMGVDASTDAGGHFLISGGTIISKGSMGAWDSPTSGSTQAYVSLPTSTNINNGFAIKYNNDDIIIFKAPTINGSGFETGTKPPPGGGGSNRGNLVVCSPQFTRGTAYQAYTSVTISGGTQWHGLYSGASYTISGSSTNVTAQ